MEKDIKEAIDAKVKEALENLFDEDENFELKFQNTVRALLQSYVLIYHLRSIILGNPNVYA